MTAADCPGEPLTRRGLCQEPAGPQAQSTATVPKRRACSLRAQK
jgi:hypothetical protein